MHDITYQSRNSYSLPIFIPLNKRIVNVKQTKVAKFKNNNVNSEVV